MSTHEIERYELAEASRYLFDFNRRGFLKTFGGGLLVLLVSPRLDGQESGRARGGGEPLPTDVNAWLHIAPTGEITVFTGKTEVGQNIRTSLTQAVAEELHVPVTAVTLLMADTAQTPFDMGTFGSRTTPTMNAQLRRVAVTARQALVTRAAEHWQVSPEEVTIVDGQAFRRGASDPIAIGELVKNAPLTAVVASDVSLAPSASWRIAGTSLHKIDGAAFVTGRHEYTSDLQRPGMLHGRMIRPPRFGAELASVDSSAAQAVPGVVVVREGNFLGVVAASTEEAARAAALVKPTWNGGGAQTATTLFDDLRRTAEAGVADTSTGDVDAARAAAASRVDSVFTVAYIAHCPLEPRAAAAEWNGDALTVWTGTQRPFGVQGELADAFHIPKDRVRVIVPDTGSAYGGKHMGDAAVEAARLSKAAGKPVKLVWTREEEMTWAYFRPAGVIDVRSAVDSNHRITAWEFHNYNSGGSGIRTPYDIPNQRVVFHQAASPLRQGSYRGLAATANHFARETHMDEIASSLGVDPLAFRLQHLSDARVSAVLNAAADRFGWQGRRKTAGHGFGLAAGTEKGGYVATCAEIAVNGRDVQVARVVVAFECGAIVNPDGLRNQVEGAVIQGLGGALFEAIAFDGGQIQNARFSDYRVPRFHDVPQIETVLVNRADLPSAGAGETPIVGIAPAVGNAIFDATGIRLRSLPLVPQGLPLPSSASR